MSKLIRSVPFIMFAIAALGLAACGGDSSDGDGATATPAATDAPAATDVPAGDSGGDELSITQWAAQFCVAVELVEGFEDVGDPIDPTTLSLEDRKQRAQLIIDELLSILDDAAAAIAAVEPPSSVRNYHVSFSDQISAITRAVQVQQEEVAKAQSHEDIEAGNALMFDAVEGARADYIEAAGNLPDDAGAAIRGVTNCGDLSTATS